ncbi:MAG: hypothetical protein K0S65_6424, partial [Labilithrix sp.]|nr:hypothetical protein [Labilithrix sp.]
SRIDSFRAKATARRMPSPAHTMGRRSLHGERLSFDGGGEESVVFDESSTMTRTSVATT